MQKIIIGIPRALLYYRYAILWQEFFQNLGCQVIVSPKTNKQIIEQGNNLVVDEACLSLKIFMGHVSYLKDKCDYLFLPRIANVKCNEKVCTNFLAIYDLVKNSFPKLPILNFNYDYEKGIEERDCYLKIGKQLDFSYLKSYNAYLLAKKKEEEHNLLKKQLWVTNLKSTQLKIMVVAHVYNLYDEFTKK